MEEPSTSTDAKTPISLEELTRRLYCPMEPVREPSSEPSLSYIPWILQDEISSKIGQETDDTVSGGNKDLASTNSQHTHFPSFSYLDLRRRQNHAWALDRLQEGNKEFFIDPTKAETLYQQGLELIPHHVELLLAYGKLLMHRQRPTAALSQWKKIVDLHPDHVVAQELIQRAERQQQPNASSLVPGRQKKNSHLTLAREESSAFQDALIERNLAMEAANEDTSEPKASSRRKKHKKKRHKRKRRRRYSSDDSTSSDNRDGSQPKRRRRHDSDASDMASDSDVASEDDSSQSRRRRRRHRKRRKEHRSKRSKRHRHKRRDKGIEDSASEPNSS